MKNTGILLTKINYKFLFGKNIFRKNIDNHSEINKIFIK
jgi:hypothetical protein